MDTLEHLSREALESEVRRLRAALQSTQVDTQVVDLERDMAAQLQASRDALARSEARFSTILETIESAFAIVKVKYDADDKPVDYYFVEANPAFERQCGVNLRGKWVTEFAPNLESFWFETYGHVAKTGEPANFENYANTFERWFDVRAVRVGDPADRQIAILFNDVTERRDAEERLRASEALARENVERVQLALAAGAIIGTWHWDLPTDRFAVDEAFARVFDLDPALGREGLRLEQVMATVHPEDRDGLTTAINEAIGRGGAYSHQYRVRRADGEYQWIEANGRVECADDGTPLRFPGVLIDVEERRNVEAERDRAIAALRALNDTLEQRVSSRTAELMQAEEKLRQSQKMEAVGQLTGGLAHDFNNLLAGISGALELMGARISQGRLNEVDKYMVTAQGAVKRAAALTHRLLAFSRRQTLAAGGAISQEELSHARDDLTSAQNALANARQQLKTSSALVDDTVVSSHPDVMSAAADLRQAYLTNARSTLIAPVTGYVAKRTVQLGQRVQPGTALMAVIPLDQLWIDANFKETQLRDMRIGQPVDIESDIYGSDVKYSGTVDSLGAGTGSAFALLPAQNATGNWIKIVQRVPVRIHINAEELARHPLRVGLSTNVEVNLHDQSGPVLAQQPPQKASFSTNVYDRQLAEADAMIAQLIHDNSAAASKTAQR